MRAKRRFYRKMTYPDGAILEAVIWRIPAPTPDRPHGLKCRLYYGTADGTTVIRYDNETGKGDHRHYGGREEPYRFVDEVTLYADFMADVERTRKRRK